MRTRQVSVFHSFSAIPFYLVCVPLLIFLLRSVFLEGLVTSSRSYAIYNAGPLIRDIEGYKLKKGFYPNSLLSVVKDYKTNVRGIPLYHYEPAGEAYNLYFEQNSDKFGIREIVMYNKLNQQEMTSHDQDLLLLSENELRQQRGYLKAQRLPDLHWKYFWFD